MTVKDHSVFTAELCGKSYLFFSLGCTVGQLVLKFILERKEVIVGKWTLKASKRNLDRGICSAVKTVSSSMNYSVFVRNRVMFTASIQISLPTESPHDVLCVNACFFLNIIRCKRSIYFHSHITFISRFVQNRKKKINLFLSFRSKGNSRSWQ